MPSIVAELLDFQTEHADLGKIFSVLFVAIFSGVVFIAFRYAFWRRNINRILPGKKLSLFNLLGNLEDIPSRKASRNGHSFNVFLMQLLTGHAEMFTKENLFCFWISYAPFIVVAKAEAVEALISGTKMMQKGWTYGLLNSWLGTGLLTSYGPKWKSRRKLLTPSFHFEILKEFLPVFNEQAQILVGCLQKETSKDFTEIVTPITLCSLDIICETTLGVSIKAQENRESQYVTSVLRTADIIMERAVNCLYWSDTIFGFTKMGKELKGHLKVLHGFTRSVIQEKKTKLLNGVDTDSVKKKRKALMDVLLEHHVVNKSLTEEDIREEVDTFTFEGHDTTSMGMSWALYLIGLHEDVQEKLHVEMDHIFGGDLERPITNDDLNDMKYLDCVLKESLRLYPSVPFFARHATEDFKLLDHTIPKGSTCLILAYWLHRDKNVFPNPEKFDPDRFSPESSATRHPYAYIPFSAGPRNCIGQRFALMEEKVVIANVLRNFTLWSLDKRDNLPPAPELILRSSTQIRIRIRKRILK